MGVVVASVCKHMSGADVLIFLINRREVCFSILQKLRQNSTCRNTHFIKTQFLNPFSKITNLQILYICKSFLFLSEPILFHCSLLL